VPLKNYDKGAAVDLNGSPKKSSRTEVNWQVVRERPQERATKLKGLRAGARRKKETLVGVKKNTKGSGTSNVLDQNIRGRESREEAREGSSKNKFVGGKGGGGKKKRK